MSIQTEINRITNTVDAQTTQINALIEQANNLPAAGGGGGDEEYELIFTETVTEDAGGYFRDKDADGKTFALKKAILIVFTPPFEDYDNSYGRALGFVPETRWGHANIGNLRDSIKSSAGGNGWYDINFVELIMGYQVCTAKYESQNSSNVFGAIMPNTRAGVTGLQFYTDTSKLMQFYNVAGPMTCVKIAGYSGGMIVAKNTQIALYGVRT